MCGIAGVVTRFPVRSGEYEPVLSRVLDRMSYRGPDGMGLWSDSRVMLGHRRLSIIDLSPAGAQPFHDEENHLHLSFNGEVYNHLDLRTDTISKGYRFRSRSDTEALLGAYWSYGNGFLDRLRGMFAFILYDEKRKKILFARDRLGKKPLYYYFDGSRLLMFSELKFFHAFKDIELTIDEESVEAFFALQYIPGPHTIYKQIRRVMPGECLTLDMTSWEISSHRYWSIGDHIGAPSVQHTDADIEAMISESVRYRLIADVEIGILLSGGIDSSLLACLAAGLSQRRPRAFLVSFPQKSLDESVYAKSVASALGIELVEVSGGAVSEETFTKAVYHADEPLADPAIIPTFLISEALSHYVKVVISGEGADELFWGYRHYQREIACHALIRKLRPLLSPCAGASLLSWLDINPRIPAPLSRLIKILCSSWEIGAGAWTTTFGEAALHDLLPRDMAHGSTPPRFARELESLFLEFKGKAGALEASMALDTACWLPDDLLVKVDRMTMAHGIEARTPFLDHVLVGMALRLSPEAKADRYAGKKPLRRLLHARLPANIADMIVFRKKHGFEVPFPRWLRSDLRGLADRLVRQAVESRMEYIDTKLVDGMWKRFKNNDAQPPFARKLWLLVCFLMWMEHHRNRFGF